MTDPFSSTSIGNLFSTASIDTSALGVQAPAANPPAPQPTTGYQKTFEQAIAPIPKYGTSGADVAAYQQGLNDKYGSKAGYIPLKIDGVFGPKTQLAANFSDTGPAIVSTADIHSQAIKDSNDLDQHMAGRTGGTITPPTPDSVNIGTFDNPKWVTAAPASPTDATGAPSTPAGTATAAPDPYAQRMQAISDTSDAATKSLIATINASHQNQANAINDKYDRYESGMRLLGIENGTAALSPDYLRSNLNQIKAEQSSKIADLDQKQASALSKAYEARANNDYKALKASTDEARQAQSDKLALIRAQSTLDSDLINKAKFYGNTIVDNMQGLNGDQKAAVIKQLSSSLGIPAAYLIASASTAAKALAKSSRTSASASSTASKKTAIANITNRFNDKTPGKNGVAIMGADNKIDPYVYIDAHDQWIKAGHSDKEWNSEFPAAKYISSEDMKLLPGGIAPAKKANAGRGSQ